MTPSDDAEPHEEFEALFSDLHDGTLPSAEQDRVRAHLEGCAACRDGYAAHVEMMAAFAGARQRAPEPSPTAFGRSVEETIHRRSAGRFFGRKTLGDRVPFGALLVVALVVLVGAAALLWSSTTGSLRYRPSTAPPEPAPGAADKLRPP